MATGSLTERMVGAALLRVSTFEEVEADGSATGQAAAVVVMVAVASAVGAYRTGLGAALLAPVGALVGWLVWAGITYLIGDKILGGTATWGELLRTLGFAQTPGLLYLLAWFPLLGFFVRTLVPLWMLVAGILAVRQALDFGTGRALVTVVLGWLVLAVQQALLGGLF